MKTENMQKKINQLFLTGKTKFRKGNAYCLINEKTKELLFNCLYHSHDISTIELKKIDYNHLFITATKQNGDCVLFGTIETY